MKLRTLTFAIAFAALTACGYPPPEIHALCGTDAAIDSPPPDAPPSVYQDPTSGIYIPQTTTEWTNLSLPAPDHIWLVQEASGNLADGVGTATLIGSGTRLYQQTVPGWTTKALGMVYTTQGYWYSVDSSLPSLTTTSQTYLLYWRFISAPASTQHISLNGYPGTGGGALQFRSDSDCKPVIYIGTTLGKMVNSHCDGVVHAMLVTFDRTHSAMHLSSDLEHKVETFPTGAAGREFMLGGVHNLDQQFLAAFAWDGTKGEMPAQAQWDLISALGFTMGWARP